MTLACRPGVAETAEGLHVEARVGIEPLLPLGFPGLRDQPAEGPVVLRAVREERQLLGGVEANEAARRRVLGEETPQADVGEDALDEVLAEPRVVQAPVLLDGKEREALGSEGARRARGPFSPACPARRRRARGRARTRGSPS